MNPREKFRRQFTFLSDRRITGDETQRRYTWFTEKSTRPDVATRPRGRILREIAFPENFRGLYSARFSPDGAVIATAYGGGAIQVLWTLATTICFINGFMGLWVTNPKFCIALSKYSFNNLRSSRHLQNEVHGEFRLIIKRVYLSFILHVPITRRRILFSCSANWRIA